MKKILIGASSLVLLVALSIGGVKYYHLKNIAEVLAGEPMFIDCVKDEVVIIGHYSGIQHDALTSKGEKVACESEDEEAPPHGSKDDSVTL